MVNLTTDEAIHQLQRYTNEYYTPQNRQAHLMAIEALREKAKDSVADVVHGRWEKSIDNETVMHRCSECGARVVKGVYEYENPNRYCYRCGAKMDLEENNAL